MAAVDAADVEAAQENGPRMVFAVTVPVQL